MENYASYKICFVNESAASIDFGNVIDKEVNAKAIALFNYLTQHPIEGMIEAIPPTVLFLFILTFLHCEKKSPRIGKHTNGFKPN
jgi:allophanate hydrolase subunit 1